jgi:hypothetical protein
MGRRRQPFDAKLVRRQQLVMAAGYALDAHEVARPEIPPCERHKAGPYRAMSPDCSGHLAVVVSLAL